MYQSRLELIQLFMKKILIGPSSFAQLDETPMLMLQQAGFEIVDNPFKRRLTESEVMQLLDSDVVGLIAGLEPLNRKVLSASNLQVVSRVGAGLANVDLDAAKNLGIDICYTPYGPTKAVAELTLATLLSLIRFIPQMDSSLHNGEWNKKIGFQLDGKIIVIIGYGRIGRQFAEYLVPFNNKIIIVDPFIDKYEVDYEVMSLNDAITKADIISMHLSGEECLIGEKEIASMKDGVFLLNAARGGIISESALISSLKSGKIAGAWIDTFEKEPYSGPLSNFDNVILTPHVGSYTLECRKQMETEAVENLINSFNKKQ